MFVMFYGLLFLSLLQFLNGLPERSLDKRIHHGEKSNEPYALYFEQFRGMEALECTASLIKKQYIITAAHCFKDDFDRTRVTYGCSNVRSNDCERVGVASWKKHPQYSEVSNRYSYQDMYDIAVAKLESPIDVEPISLPSGEKTNWVPKGMAYLVGYGLTESQGMNNYQRSTTLPIVDSSKNTLYGTTGEKIIVEIQESRTDHGDSGGPLVIDNTLYGVLSGAIQYPAHTKVRPVQLYMSVNHYREFIDKAIEALEEE